MFDFLKENYKSILIYLSLLIVIVLVIIYVIKLLKENKYNKTFALFNESSSFKREKNTFITFRKSIQEYNARLYDNLTKPLLITKSTTSLESLKIIVSILKRLINDSNYKIVKILDDSYSALFFEKDTLIAYSISFLNEDELSQSLDALKNIELKDSKFLVKDYNELSLNGPTLKNARKNNFDSIKIDESYYIVLKNKENSLIFKSFSLDKRNIKEEKKNLFNNISSKNFIIESINDGFLFTLRNSKKDIKYISPIYKMKEEAIKIINEIILSI